MWTPWAPPASVWTSARPPVPRYVRNGPGNHDPDVSGYRTSRTGLTLQAGLPARPPWPDGAVSAEQAIVDVAGLRLAGLGGCRRYSDGPNQYTQRQQARRARSLSQRARW